MMQGMARLVTGVVLVLAVAWLGTWWYVEGRLTDMLTAYTDVRTTADGGSALTYDNISRGTNPLVASATLNNVRWTMQPSGQEAPMVVTAAQVTVWIDASNPQLLHIGLPKRIDISTPQTAGSIIFGSITVDAGLDPRALFNRKIYALTGHSLAIQNMDVVAGGGGLPLLHIDSITGHETFNAAARPGQTAVSGEDSIDGVALPAVWVALAHVPFGGKITHIGLQLMLSGPADRNGLMEPFQAPLEKKKQVIEALHTWAEQGGSGKAGIVITLGPSTLNASGAVAFGANAQPSGTADVTADHLDSFTAALVNAYPHLQQSIANIEGQLSPYLATTGAGGQVLTVHVSYGKPGVLVNGTRRMDMPPLDWSALENPPAAVPQAPGDGSGAAAP